MWEYTDKVKEHFMSPRNVGTIDDANGIGDVGSLSCGDALRLFLKIENDIIVDAKFQTFGCASAIASSSALTEMIIGKPVTEAEKITNKDIAAYLGGLPKEKIHCSVMGEEALEAAIKSYRGEPVTAHEEHGEVVCHCFGITKEQIEKAVKEHNIENAEDVSYYIKAGGGCGNCLDRIDEIITDVRQENTKKPLIPIKAMTNLERIRKIEEVISSEIRPKLELEGGGIELIDVQGTRVKVGLFGRCTNCPSSQVTIKETVEKTLREKVDADITVEGE